MLKKGLCILSVLLMLGCVMSISVMAEEKAVGEGLVNLDSIQLNGDDRTGA